MQSSQPKTCPNTCRRRLVIGPLTAGEDQSCEEGEAVGDEPRLQDPVEGAQVGKHAVRMLVA